MIKTIVYFISMKIMEISGLVFIPYFMGKWQLINSYLFPSQKPANTIISAWCEGFIVILAIVGTAAGIWITMVAGWDLIKLNWRFAKRKAGIKR